MTEETKPTALGKAREIAELAVATGTVVYILGFIIINSFLCSYGIVSFNFLSAKYIAVGICFAAFYAVVAIIPLSLKQPTGNFEVWDKMEQEREKTLEVKKNEFRRYREQKLEKDIGKFRETGGPDTEEKIESLKANIQNEIESNLLSFEKSFRRSYNITHRLGVQAGLVIVYSILFVVLMYFVFRLTGSDVKIFTSVYTYIWVLIIAFGFGLLIDFFKQPRRRNYILLPLAGLSLVISAVLYGQHLYPFVSPSVGGGMPREANFIVAAEKNNMIEKALGIEIERNVTPLMTLIAETSDYYMILLENGNCEQVAQLEKSMIQGIIYGRPEGGLIELNPEVKALRLKKKRRPPQELPPREGD